MPTRFYLPSSGSSPVSLSGAVTTWSGQANTWTASKAVTAKTNTALTDVACANPLGASRIDVDFVNRSFVSDPLTSAMTISGTFSAVLSGFEGTTSQDAFVDIHIAVLVGDTSTVRGTLYAGSHQTASSATVGAENEEMSLTPGTSRIKNARTLTSVAAQSGDRILIEIGIEFGSALSGASGTLTYGDPTGTSDFSLSSGQSRTAGDPWVEFSADLFGPPALSGTLTVTGSGSASFSGTPAWSGSLAVTGSGTATWSGVPGGKGSLAQTGSGTASFGGVPGGLGSLSATGSGSLTFGLSLNGALPVTGSGTLTLGRVSYGLTGALAQTGSGTLTLAPSRVTVSGALTVSGSGALSLAQAKIAVNGTLTVTGSGALSLTGKPAAFGTLAQTGVGTLSMSGFGTFQHNIWTASGWKQITPLVWDGTAWVYAIVRLTAGRRSASTGT